MGSGRRPHTCWLPCKTWWHIEEQAPSSSLSAGGITTKRHGTSGHITAQENIRGGKSQNGKATSGHQREVRGSICADCDVGSEGEEAAPQAASRDASVVVNKGVRKQKMGVLSGG